MNEDKQTLLIVKSLMFGFGFIAFAILAGVTIVAMSLEEPFIGLVGAVTSYAMAAMLLGFFDGRVRRILQRIGVVDADSESITQLREALDG